MCIYACIYLLPIISANSASNSIPIKAYVKHLQMLIRALILIPFPKIIPKGNIFLGA